MKDKMWTRILVSTLLGCFILKVHGITETEIITNSVATAADKFGLRVALSGDVAIAGAQERNTYAGEAYIYRFNGSFWNEEQTLAAADAVSSDYFGSSAGISGDVAIVGARESNSGGISNSGAAYVFRYDGSTWDTGTKIKASDGASGDNFGISSDISGDWAVVGASFADVSNTVNAGKVYVFHFDGSWIEEQIITPSPYYSNGYFGTSVAIDGDVLIIGAQGHSVSTGAAYIYRYNGSLWVEDASLTASDSVSQDFFGNSVSIVNDLAIVGARYHHTAGLDNAGAAYVFRYNGTSWVTDTKLVADDAAASDQFGVSVSIGNNIAAVGALARDSGGVSNAGSVYMFTSDGSSWDTGTVLTASDGEANDRLGIYVSLSGSGDVLAGTLDSGALYYFAGPTPAPTVSPTVSPTVAPARVVVQISGWTCSNPGNLPWRKADGFTSAYIVSNYNDCANDCIANPTCEGFQFASATGACWLHRVCDITPNSIYDSGVLIPVGVERFQHDVICEASYPNVDVEFPAPTEANRRTPSECLVDCNADPTCSRFTVTRDGLCSKYSVSECYYTSKQNKGWFMGTYDVATQAPTTSPTQAPTAPTTQAPTLSPTVSPTPSPTVPQPTTSPTQAPTQSPTETPRTVIDVPDWNCNNPGNENFRKADGFTSAESVTSYEHCKQTCLDEPTCEAFTFRPSTLVCFRQRICDLVPTSFGWRTGILVKDNVANFHHDKICPATYPANPDTEYPAPDPADVMYHSECALECEADQTCDSFMMTRDGLCLKYASSDCYYTSKGNNGYFMGVFDLPTPAPTQTPTASPTPNPRVAVGKVSLNINFNNTTKSKEAAKRLIQDTKAQYTDTEYLVSGKDTVSLPQSVQTSSGATDQELIDAIKASRNCSECTVTLGSGGRRLSESNDRRELDATIVAEISFTLDEAAFNELESSGNTLESPEFLNALAEDLGVNSTDIVVTVVGSEVVVEVTLIATSTEEDPLDETAIQQLQQLQQASTEAANTIVSEIGDGIVTVDEVDLCQGRTCSGRGVYEEGVTDANGCIIETGVCQCSGDWWGINCEIACSCENGGICINSYCQCEYPYHGVRCQLTKTSDCTACF